MAAPGVFPKVSGDTVSRLDYNAIQTLAYGVKTTFLGQVCASAPVALGATISYLDWNNLKTDIDYCISYLSLSVTAIPTRTQGEIIRKDDVNLYYTNAYTADVNKTWFINLVIGADTQNYTLSGALASNGTYIGSRVGKSTITVTVNSGVYVGATSTANYALQLDGTTTGDTVTLVNNGTIIGAGGAGGRASPYRQGFIYGDPGVGGNALYAPRVATVYNNGSLYGGGGGGGQGGWFTYDVTTGSGKNKVTTTYTASGGGGGGGAGYAVGAAGLGGTGGNGSNGTDGTAGTRTAGGAGGTLAGAGGGPGLAGVGATANGQYYVSPGAQPGNYIVGNANVTWLATGTRQGLVG
jgi:hypothetical protein